MFYIAEKNGKKFRVNGKQTDVYRKAGYTVTEEPTVKKATKTKTKAAETADTAE